MGRLKGKVIIVTGSCTGIGRAIAKRCSSEGAKLIIHGLQPELGQEIVNDLGAANSCLWIEDLTNPGCPERLVELACRQYGRLDAVVNNAALIAAGNIHDSDEVRLSEFLAINTLAPYRMIRAALTELAKTRGCVLNIGSVNAHSGEPDLLPYSISKGALMTMTRNLGDTLMRESNIRVNQINPGWVLTEAEIRRKREEGFPDNWTAMLPDVFAPAKRILAPEEIAAAAVYWLSDEAGPISGQVVDLEQYPFIGRNPPKENRLVHPTNQAT